MYKNAYHIGVLQALAEAGIKVANDDDPHMYDGTHNNQNPAEQLASMFSQEHQQPGLVAPDNKTKLDEADMENDPHWGAVQPGSHGAEALARQVQDFHMPTISSV